MQRNALGEWGAGSALRIAFVSAAIAFAALWYRSSLMPMTRLDGIQICEYAFIFFASLALVALYSGFSKSWKLHRFLGIRGLIFPVAALLGAAAYKLGMHQFGGFDEGLIVHAASYYAQGLRPYVDFPSPMPPLFMAALRGAVGLLGLRWSSVLATAVTYTILTSVWMFALLRRAAMPRHWALAVTVCVEMSTMVMCPFWWYNNTSVIAVVLLLCSVLACIQQNEGVLSWTSLALSLGMVMASKPNIEPACLMVLVLLATRDKAQWLKVLSAGVVATAFACAVCAMAQMPLLPMLHSYSVVAKLRGNPLSFFPFREMGWVDANFQGLFLILNVLCFAALLIVSARNNPRHWRAYTAFAIASAVAVLLACANGEYPNLELCIMLVASAFLCLRPWQNSGLPIGRKMLLASLLATSFVMAGFFAAIHLRILGIGEGMFYEPLATRKIQNGFFAGLEAGPRLQAVLAQTAEVINRYPANTIFFGPRMEFEYAVFNKPPMPGMPLLWDVGNLFPSTVFPGYLLTFQHQDPDLLIFLKNDYTRMGAVGFYIQHSPTYRRIDDYSQLTVYIRNKEVPVTYIKIPAAMQEGL